MCRGRVMVRGREAGNTSPLHLQLATACSESCLPCRAPLFRASVTIRPLLILKRRRLINTARCPDLTVDRRVSPHGTYGDGLFRHNAPMRMTVGGGEVGE